MQKRAPDQSDLEVSAMGLGWIGMSFSYGPAKYNKEIAGLVHEGECYIPSTS